MLETLEDGVQMEEYVPRSMLLKVCLVPTVTPGFPRLCGERLEELCHMIPWYDSFATSLTQNQYSQLTMN